MPKLDSHITSEGITIPVRVVPRSHRDEIIGIDDRGALKIRLAAPPVEGLANERLVKFLAKELGVRNLDVEILRGSSSRNKLVRLRRISLDRIESLAGEEVE